MLKEALAAGTRRAGGWAGAPARPGSVLTSAGGARAACGGGGGPGSAGAETGLAGSGRAERPGRTEPAGAAHPGADAGNTSRIHSVVLGEARGAWSGVCGVRWALRDSAVIRITCRWNRSWRPGSVTLCGEGMRPGAPRAAAGGAPCPGSIIAFWPCPLSDQCRDLRSIMRLY